MHKLFVKFLILTILLMSSGSLLIFIGNKFFEIDIRFLIVIVLSVSSFIFFAILLFFRSKPKAVVKGKIITRTIPTVSARLNSDSVSNNAEPTFQSTEQILPKEQDVKNEFQHTDTQIVLNRSKNSYLEQENKNMLEDCAPSIELTEAEELQENDELNINLEELPEIKIQEKDNSITEDKEKQPTDKISRFKNYLIDDSTRVISRTDHGDENITGKLSSIGKLLLSERDIENIIETNALMQHLGEKTDRLTLLSVAEADKYKLLFKKILDGNNLVKNVSIADNSGTLISAESIVKNMIELSAISVHVAQVTDIYLKPVFDEKVKYLLVESDSHAVFLTRNKGKYLIVDGHAKFNPFENQPLEFKNFSKYTKVDLKMVTDNLKAHRAMILDSNGGTKIEIGSYDEKLIAVSVAIFENLNSFFNSQIDENLLKISIYTENRVIIINKENNKFLFVEFNIEELGKLSEKFDFREVR